MQPVIQYVDSDCIYQLSQFYKLYGDYVKETYGAGRASMLGRGNLFAIIALKQEQ